jgi:Zn finger protein HypA/HybF involved in hydrogenase expression
MHELSLVEELVDECNRLAAGRRVAEVRARCPLVVDVDELVEGFKELTSGGSLGDAELVIEAVPVALHCKCGFEGEMDSAELVGHLAICPGCGQVQEAETGLELVALRLVDRSTSGPMGV